MSKSSKSSFIFTKKKFMKGGELQLSHDLLFKIALQITEGITNYALTHKINLTRATKELNNITPALVSIINKSQADIYQEIIFDKDRMGLYQHVICPRDDCTLTFKDLANIVLSFNIDLPNGIGIWYINNQSLERIIIGPVFLTRNKRDDSYNFDKSLEDTLKILTNLDKKFEELLSSKKLESEPYENQSRWWDLYKTYAEAMGNPELEALKLKVLYDNDPSKMIGGKVKRLRDKMNKKHE